MSQTSSSPIPAAEREFREAMTASRRPVHDSVVDRHLARAQHFALTGIAEMLEEICEHLRGPQPPLVTDPSTLKPGDFVSWRIADSETRRTDELVLGLDGKTLLTSSDYVIVHPDGSVPPRVRDLRLVEAALDPTPSEQDAPQRGKHPDPMLLKTWDRVGGWTVSQWSLDGQDGDRTITVTYVEKPPHQMIPGSHEYARGTECRCGRPWDLWRDACSGELVNGQR